MKCKITSVGTVYNSAGLDPFISSLYKMFYLYIPLKITLDQGWAAQVVKIHFPTELCSNPD